VIGVAVKPLHPSAVAVKFRLAGAWKSSDGGLKTYHDRLGIPRDHVTAVQPGALQSSDASAITAPGSAPVPATCVNVTVTPLSAKPPLSPVSTPPTSPPPTPTVTL